jgi:hypothetical protein
MQESPKLFTCPKCRETYLGRDPLPDCPRCGYDYREREGFRWDVLAFLVAILGLMSYLLVSSYYRSNIGAREGLPGRPAPTADSLPEKLPGGGTPMPFESPYEEGKR